MTKKSDYTPDDQQDWITPVDVVDFRTLTARVEALEMKAIERDNLQQSEYAILKTEINELRAKIEGKS